MTFFSKKLHLLLEFKLYKKMSARIYTSLSEMDNNPSSIIFKWI